jgi:hypothetical protein
MMKMENSPFTKRLDCLYRQGLACQANWSNWIRRDRLTLQAIRNGWLDEGLVSEKEVKSFDLWLETFEWREGWGAYYPPPTNGFETDVDLDLHLMFTLADGSALIFGK